MTITLEHLKKMAALAYLAPEDAEALLDEANIFLTQMSSLHEVHVDHVAPLLHPVSTHQTLRVDEVSEENCREELAEIAPLFLDGHYIVPRVIRGK